jgi:hypothetical protein
MKHNALKPNGALEMWLNASLTLVEMVVCGYLNDQAALHPRKQSPIPISYAAECVAVSVWMLWNRDDILLLESN